MSYCRCRRRRRRCRRQPCWHQRNCCCCGCCFRLAVCSFAFACFHGACVSLLWPGNNNNKRERERVRLLSSCVTHEYARHPQWNTKLSLKALTAAVTCAVAVAVTDAVASWVDDCHFSRNQEDAKIEENLFRGVFLDAACPQMLQQLPLYTTYFSLTFRACSSATTSASAAASASASAPVAATSSKVA